MAEQRHAVPFNVPPANSVWRQCWLRLRQIRLSSRLPATLGGLCLCLLVLAFSSMAPFKNGTSLSLMDSSTGNANEKTQRETISLSLPAIGSSTSAINDKHDAQLIVSPTPSSHQIRILMPIRLFKPFHIG